MSGIFNINFILLSLITLFPINICIDTIALNNILLNEHNKYRKMHGVPNLVLDNKLINFATAYAESLAKNANDNYLIPSGLYYEGDEKLGENLFQCNKRTCKMENFTQPLDVWYKEKQYYNFNTNRGEKGTSNFTQMIWKSTKKLGCGVGQKTENSYKVVCYYLPKGNIADKYDINVLPLQKIAEEIIINNTNTNTTNNESLTNTNITYETYEDFITNNSYNYKSNFYLVCLILILFL